MASGGKRGAGERVLESKHVIGLFLLMLLFSGVFFTLGYVMGRNQYDGQVSAAITNSRAPEREPVVPAKPEPAPKHAAEAPTAATESDPLPPVAIPTGNFTAAASPPRRAASGASAESARDSTSIENGKRKSQSRAGDARARPPRNPASPQRTRRSFRMARSSCRWRR